MSEDSPHRLHLPCYELAMRLCFIIGLTSSAACIGLDSPKSPVVDAAYTAEEVTDASVIECASAGELMIGHCIDLATGAPCRDFDAIDRDFVEIDSDTVVPQIIGLQGSPMFVLALRMPDLEQSLKDRPPLVQLEVNLGTLFVGGYTARPAVIEDPESSNHRIAPQLYVVTLLGDEATARTVDVIAKVSTDTGLQWCSQNSFVAGMLMDPMLAARRSRVLSQSAKLAASPPPGSRSAAK